MSVIAKLYVTKITQFGTGRLLDLNCIASNETMVMYADKAHEDRLFTQASPWGEMKLNQPAMYAIGDRDAQFYVVALRDAEAQAALRDPPGASFPGAYGFCKARCNSLTDFGGTSKQVEFYNVGRTEKVDSLNWKMTVDNPGAHKQFAPGTDDWWIAFYPASDFTVDQALAAAHGHG